MEPEAVEAHTRHMRHLALEARRRAVSFDSIRQPHRDILNTAIRNVLATELAVFTFAQIIDGLPTADVAWDQRRPGIFGDHPIEEHEELCPGAMERAEELRQDWSPSFLKFNPKVGNYPPLTNRADIYLQTVSDYENSQPDSKDFQLRLIELVAVSLHQSGAALFDMKLELHQGSIEKCQSWVFSAPTAIYVPPRPTLFNHHAYLYEEVYPDGVADIVGYWTENRILGGVVVFDRSEGAVGKSPNVYFHTARDSVTHRVYQLLDEQQAALVDFLMHADGENAHSPLPILGDKRNTVRVDSEVAIPHKQIYRDRWERKPYTRSQLLELARRPQAEIDYPEILEEMLRINAQLGFPLPAKPSSSKPDS